MIRHEMRTCNKCGLTQTVPVKKPNHILHLILSLLTGGFWLIVYAAAGIESAAATKPKCFSCKAKL
jgi:hypothetical protein